MGSVDLFHQKYGGPHDLFHNGNKYIVEGKIFQEEVGVLHCYYKGWNGFANGFAFGDSQLIFQLDLTPNIIQQLQADVSARPHKGGKLKLNLKFAEDFDNYVRVRDWLVIDFDKNNFSGSALVLDIS